MIHDCVHGRFGLLIGEVSISIYLLLERREELPSESISLIIFILVSQNK
jgi:hypothetical protein